MALNTRISLFLLSKNMLQSTYIFNMLQNNIISKREGYKKSIKIYPYINTNPLQKNSENGWEIDFSLSIIIYVSYFPFLSFPIF